MVRSLKSVEKDGRAYSDRMDEMMYESLKAKQNPKISYQLTELTYKETAKTGDRPYVFEAKGQLAVAGVTNEITMPVNITALRQGRFKITGSVTVKMTDYEIEPPSPTISLGLIKTGDDVKLSFDWMVEQRSSDHQSADH
jgi:polyisoprenoid-binding protein YceI